ncbi:MAG: AAA family ATPase, partial [Armatimonadota bacterium]
MPTDTRACWTCGFENAAGAWFCSNCGRPQRAACPECGAQVADGAKFCSNCGIPLGSPTRQGEDPSPALAAEARKIITVVFADLVGSTSLTERLDPEEARDVVGKFYRVVQTAVERFEGAVANLLGDAVLAVFGLPLTHEDDPERAVRAGLALRDALPALNEHFGAAHGVALDLRVGINTGEVVAASGSTFDRDFLVSDAVTTAARLQQSVAPGLVVVGERTYRLTRDAIDYRPLPPLEVKGKTAALAVWEAVAPLPERSEIRRIAAPLVGRHGELGILRYLYHRSRDESLIHLATVLGQAGVGKSRLVREFLAEVRESEPRPLILRGRSVAFGQHIGYHALLDVLRAQAGLLDTDPADVMRAKLDAWLRDVLPGQVGLLEGLLLTFGGEDGTHSDPGQMRHLLFEVWQALLGGLAAQQPVILVLEDVHWADDGLLDLVAWLTEHIDAAPVLLLCAGRPELLERRPTWGAGRRNATSIDLAPLRSGEAEQLVAALSSEGMSSEMRQTIAQRAEGNPFFVEELVRMLLEGSGPGAAIPDTVQAVLTARLDRLPPHEHRVVQAAAVFGRTFWTSAVSPLAGLSEDDTLKATDALIAKELIVRRPHSSLAGQREFAFRHILTRDVAYGMLPKSQRQRAHLQAARWLESQLEERVEEAVEILAEHLHLSGDDAQAARYLQRAAGKARRLYANADAIRLYSQAEESARRVGLLPRELAALYLGRGEVYQLTGDYARALTDFGQGLDAARQAQDPALEATLENRVGLVHHRQMRLAEAQ